jgi:hypothetical protein
MVDSRTHGGIQHGGTFNNIHSPVPSPWESDNSYDEEEAALLFRDAVRTSPVIRSSRISLPIVNLANSENDDDESISTSEESFSTALSVTSMSNADPSRNAKSTFVKYNPQTIYSGTFVQTLQSFSSDAEDESVQGSLPLPSSGQTKLEGAALSHSLSQSHGSNNHKSNASCVVSFADSADMDDPVSSCDHSSSGCYIFMDDDEEYIPMSTSTASNVDTKGVSDPDANGHDARTSNIAASNDCSRVVDKDRHKLLSSTMSPLHWEQYQKERGRIVAQKLLQPYYKQDGAIIGRKSMGSETAGGDTASLSDEGDENSDVDAFGHRRRRVSPLKLGMLGRVVGGFVNKCFVESTSPLDQEIVTTSTKNVLPNKHRISDSAVQALSEGDQSYMNSCSAVLTRNNIVDFGSWEAALKVNDYTQESKSRSSGEHTDSEEHVVVAKAATLLVKDFIAESSISKMSTLREELEDPYRPTAEDVASALGIVYESRVLLDHVRGRAGIIDDLQSLNEPEPTQTSPPETTMIPWIHLYDALWMPHYEEYVVRAVHAFARLLLFRHHTTNAASMQPTGNRTEI